MSIWIIERRDGQHWIAHEITSADKRESRLYMYRSDYPKKTWRLAEYQRVSPKEHCQD